jgi:hypothetical protein
MVGLFLMLRILLLTSRCLVESVCFPICNLSGAQHSESHFCHFGVTDFVSTSALQWCSHLVSLIYIYIASQDYFPICNLSDTPNLGLSIHTLLIINTYSNYHHALTLCAQLPQEFRNISQSLANPPSSPMPSLFSAKNCRRTSKSHPIQ